MASSDQQDHLQFMTEQAALQTKSLQAIEHDTHIIQALLSVFAVVMAVGVVLWLIAVFAA